MEFEYGGFDTYLIHKNEDGFYISNSNGFLMEAEQMLEVAIGLIRYADKHKNEIPIYNQKRKIDFDNEVASYIKEMNEITNKSNKTSKAGHVYLFECGGKYKIGFSKDVARRIKNLDYRPFKIKLVAKSNFISNAYDIEQQLHLEYESYRETGEWYSFGGRQVSDIKRYLNSIEEE